MEKLFNLDIEGRAADSHQLKLAAEKTDELSAYLGKNFSAQYGNSESENTRC